jgi:DNA invertase Pin-like site-specific DNA recombinase
MSSTIPAARVAVYARVSTVKQAEADLSLPDQLSSARAYCERRGWMVAAEFIEAGASGTDEHRPEFQRLMEAATSRAKPFDIVLVHSLSRFARAVMTLEVWAHRLHKAGVRLLSITQETSDDPSGVLMRQIIAAVDEHFSRENAKHTRRAMRENARQGYWNGAPTPFGYQTQEGGRRGQRIKKVLVVDEAEAEVVRRIFAMHLGREAGLPMGVKAIAATLNAQRVSFRGRPFSISNVHRILTAETYVGRFWFDRMDSRKRQPKPQSEWIALEVPAIIDRTTFDAVQASLTERSPRRTAPRVVTGPVLLTGIARCGTCGGGMTLRTGKNGRYRYYACASAAHRGKTICPGRALPMENLDQLVLDALAERVLQPERLEELLKAYLARSADADAFRRQRMARLRKEATEAAGAKTRLMKLVASGSLEPDDPDLVDQLKAAATRRRSAESEIALMESQSQDAAPRAITPAKVARFGEAIRAALREGAPEFRRAWVRLFVTSVIVNDDDIRVSGPTAALAQAAANNTAEHLEPASSLFHRVWRPIGDSNPCCRRERAKNWTARDDQKRPGTIYLSDFFGRASPPVPGRLGVLIRPRIGPLDGHHDEAGG